MQLDFFDVPSPCVGVCQSDNRGFCLGCMRSRDERQAWKNYNNDDKQKVIKRCIQRKKRKLAKKKVKVVEEVEEVNPQPSLLDPPSIVNVENNPDIDFSDFEL